MSDADTLRIQTYNILYDTSPVGGGSGTERWPLVVEGIRGAGADLVALQEVLPGRIAVIPRDLPEYRMVVSEPGGMDRATAPLLAISAIALILIILRRRRHRAPSAMPPGRTRRWFRNAFTFVLWLLVLGVPAAITLGTWYKGGLTVNEQLAYLYRPETLRFVETRTYWFSPTPTKPGSRGPLEYEPRTAQLGIFVRESGGETLAVLNVHSGHSPLSYATTAKLMRSVLDARWHGAPQILLGDFNANEKSERLARLRAPGAQPGDPPGFRDAWGEALVRVGHAGTFQWGDVKRSEVPLRLDHVLVRGPVRVLSAETAGRTRGTLFASDHNALTVDLEFPAPTRPAAPADTL